MPKRASTTAPKSAPSAVRESFRRLAPAERRAQIIDVAAQMFGERPYAELSVREVAQAAQVTDNLVYHYFTNKQALFIAAFERRSADLLAACLPSRRLALFVQLESAVRGYLDFVEQNATAYLNLFHGANETEADARHVSDNTRTRIAELYLEGLGLSGRAVPTTRLALRGHIGFIEELILRWLPQRQVPRSSIERLIYASAGDTLSTALALDEAFPAGFTQATFRKAYARHFGLA